MREIQKKLKKDTTLLSANPLASVRGKASPHLLSNFCKETPGGSLETPASFTPLPMNTPAPSMSDGSSSHNPEFIDPTKTNTTVSLDAFQMKHTSEDNAAFDKLMEKQQIIHRQKYSWLYEQEDKTNKKNEETLLLTQGSENRSAHLLTWDYNAQNALMYNPSGVSLSESEEKMAYKGPPKEIHRTNTRFHGNVFESHTKKEEEKKDDELYAKLTEEERYLLKRKQEKEGKIDLDVLRGFKKVTAETPLVRGYGFLGTPSPAPGVDASPFTTWGDVEGTPLLLDTGDTPLSFHSGSGPTFKVPDIANREKLAMELAEKSSHKFKKNKLSSQQKASPYTPSPRRVAQSPLHQDMQLRASYKSPMIRKGSLTPSRKVPSSPSIFKTPTSVPTPSKPNG